MSRVIATGEYHTLIDKNREFAHFLGRKGIGHHFEVWGGQCGHDWPWWREHLRRSV